MGNKHEMYGGQVYRHACIYVKFQKSDHIFCNSNTDKPKYSLAYLEDQRNLKIYNKKTLKCDPAREKVSWCKFYFPSGYKMNI